MSLVSCPACGSGVTLETPTCPTCGAAPAPDPRKNAIVILVLAGVGVCVSGVLIPLLL